MSEQFYYGQLKCVCIFYIRGKTSKAILKNNQVLAFNHHRISRDGFQRYYLYALLTKMPKDTLVIIMNH